MSGSLVRKRGCLLAYLLFILLFGCLMLLYSSFTSRSGLNNDFATAARLVEIRSTNNAVTAALPSKQSVFNCTRLCPSISLPVNSAVTTSFNETAAATAVTVVAETVGDPGHRLDLTHRPPPHVWTTVESVQATVFSAYYDERPEMHGPSIVLLGYHSRSHSGESLHCLFGYPDGTFACSEERAILFEMTACNRHKDYHKKTLYKFKHMFYICRLGPAQRIPTRVALSASPNCNPSSALLTVYSHRPEHKTNIGVCLETPVFKKSFADIVNFVEIQRYFGAEFFTIYLLDVTEDVESSLRNTYEKEGLMEIIQWGKHFKEKDPLHYYGEILALQDCLYRNMHRLNYLAFLDLDEVIVSRRHSNWHEMLAELDKEYIDSFIYINSVYLRTSDAEMPRSSRLWNSLLCPNQQMPSYFLHFGKSKCRFHFYERSKYIAKPLNVVDADIHGPCTHAQGKAHFFVPDDMATSQHYRDKPTVECKINRKTKKYDVTFDDWLGQHAPKVLKSIRERLCSAAAVSKH